MAKIMAIWKSGYCNGANNNQKREVKLKKKFKAKKYTE